MLLKSIKLNNIRSYLNQSIDFPKGSLLLSGDIGSGKSTVLLAIEFALFGSKPSELPASSLLRHGKKEGFVELNFEVEGKQILIKRYLKRGNDAIKQETGYIITDGLKKETSPVEMKSLIFELLGYPKDLVAKGKDLIYRYTVYTPQEEMKLILMENKDTRLNTLRKVFNIDKYKKIKENTAIFTRALKEKRKEIEGFISDLERKKNEKNGIAIEIEVLSEKIRSLEPKIEHAKNMLAKKREGISVFEDKIMEFNRLKNTIEICKANLESLSREKERNNESIERLGNQIEAFEKDIEKEAIDKEQLIKEKLMQIGSNINLQREEIDSIRERLNEFRINKRKADELISKIIAIEQCPLCLQNVRHEHKASIKEREGKNIMDAEQNINAFSEKENELRARLNSLEKEKEELRRIENKIELTKLKIKNINEKRDEKSKIEKRQEEIIRNSTEIDSKKTEIAEKIEGMKEIEEEYRKAKKELDIALEEEKKLDIEKNGLERDKISLGRILKSLEDEIGKKSKSKEKLNYFIELQNWMEEYFANLMSTMEKHVMMQVHREFNDLFKEWFDVLMEDETISVRLDDEFTPIIEQNGYETYIENLSGGEKTSVALAYRLSLNKVINDIVSEIKTKDILMLDEPTDGFSSEQLEKIRDILNQLKMKQIIIVSHEPKIESFVDKVIRIEKNEHVSMVF